MVKLKKSKVYQNVRLVKGKIIGPRREVKKLISSVLSKVPKKSPQLVKTQNPIPKLPSRIPDVPKTAIQVEFEKISNANPSHDKTATYISLSKMFNPKPVDMQ